MIDFKKMIVLALALIGAFFACALIGLYTPSWVSWTLTIVLFVGLLISYSYEPKKEPQRRYYLLVKHVFNGMSENGITQTKVIFSRASCIGTLNLPKSYFDDMGKMIELTCFEVGKETFDNFGEKAEELEQLNDKDNDGLE